MGNAANNAIKLLDTESPKGSVGGCASRLKVLADETRLAVLAQLLDGPRHVGAINEKLQVEPSLLSHHLKVLRQARLVTAVREGKQVIYRLAADVSKRGPDRAIDLGCCLISFDS